MTQDDGKIVVVGEVGTSSHRDIAVARYMPDGSLDGSFGNEGLTTISIEGREYAKSVAIQPDGKIVVGGAWELNRATDFILARFLPNGVPDTSFNGDGWAIHDFGRPYEWIQSTGFQTADRRPQRNLGIAPSECSRNGSHESSKAINEHGTIIGCE